jgi:Tfp pilus assembly protein PilN
MIPAGLKKASAFGSGIGIEISGPRGAESLRITAVRVRPTGSRMLGQFTVEDFPHQQAGVWGTEYAAFLRKFDLRHVPATVLLPRHDVIVRQLALPGVADRDLASAIQFQLEGLHPYPEDEVVSSWARLPGTSFVLIAIARRDAIDRYAGLLAEAGVKIGCFTCSAVSTYSSLRLFGDSPAKEILGWETVDGHVEFYGESPARPVFSAAFDKDEPRAAALACAELRIDPSTEPKPLTAFFSPSLAADTPALPYTAAVSSACPRHALNVNLLPLELRQNSSRMAWIPAAILGALVLLLAAALWILPAYEDRRYEQSLRSEIAKVEPAARRAVELDKQIESARQRTLLLDQFRQRSKLDMDVMSEMTRILPPQTWLNSLEITRSQVFIGGETDQAAPLLKIIDSSPLFEASEFAMPPIHTVSGENFRIRTNREAGR